MNNGLISKRYAKALWDYARARGEDEALYARMQTLLSASIAVPQMAERLQNPMVAPSDKRALLLSAMGGGKVEGSGAKFADLLLGKGREGLLQGVAVCYTALYRRSQGIRAVQITSADALPDSAMARLRADTERLTGGRVEISAKVNAGIGGGIIFQIDDLRFDASLRGQLERVRKGLAAGIKII